MSAMNPRAASAPDRPRPDPSSAPPSPARTEMEVLAFATDPRTERALREGLAELGDAQVWPGNLHAVAAALGQGHSPRLVFVDVDEIPYPAGAIYELAAVCELGTVVVAIGSDGTARFSREVLLAGVSDYLVKPVTAAAVRDSAARAAGVATPGTTEGRLVGFAGTGGSGATTLAAATALLAAERGRYVSVLDLSRTVSALSLALDVEPAGGLVDLLSTAARASLHPEMVDRMRVTRSDRIAIYGYQWSPEPPPLAPVWAVCELLVELQRRSHLVIVDGMDDPATRQTLLATVDTGVLVVEPTTAGAAEAARMTARLGPMRGRDAQTVVAQNHTRAFRARIGPRTLARAGFKATPDVVVPFEPSVPALADRGWPGDRLPRTLRKPLERLADRILGMRGSEEAVTLGRAREGARSATAASAALAGRSGRPRPAAAASRPSPVRTALRRLWPLRSARPRTT